MTSRESIKVLADVLKSEMSLTGDQIILAYSKNFIMQDKGLYISLSYVSEKAIGSVNSFETLIGGNVETQSITMQQLIQVDLMSFDSTARTRKEEVLLALNSVYGAQQMELYNLQIANLPSGFINASSLEETKFLNRFVITIAVTALISKTKALDYFDEFATPVTSYDGKLTEE